MRQIKKYLPKSPRKDNRPSAFKSDINFDIQGFEKLANDVKSLANDRVKKKQIVAILKRQMKPIEKAVKANTPIAKGDIVIRGKTYSPYNLQKSIATKTAKSAQPTVMVGPRQGKKAPYDGFYAWWHIYGWSPFYKRGSVPPKMVKPNDFIWEGAKAKINSTESGMTKELENYIGKKAKQI
jgi:hypothetical protein